MHQAATAQNSAASVNAMRFFDVFAFMSCPPPNPDLLADHPVLLVILRGSLRSFQLSGRFFMMVSHQPAVIPGHGDAFLLRDLA